MANVLPPHERKMLRRDYWLRFTTVFALVITGAMLIGSISLIPAYLLARTEHSEVLRYQEIQGETREAGKRDTAVQTARLVGTQVRELLKTDGLRASQAVTHVLRDWEVHAEDIIISGLLYELAEEKKRVIPKLRVSGEARDRGALNAFVQTLRADSTFTDVSFPVSDLAGDGAVDFSLTVQFES